MGYNEKVNTVIKKTTKLPQYIAFTIAELLIVIGIIGLIAEMTIPNLVNNYQKKVYVTQLQKSYSTLSSGFKQILASTGCSDLPCTGIIYASSDTTIDGVESSGAFSILKKCYATQTGCHDKMIYSLNGGPAWVPSDYYSILVFKDGSIVGLSGLNTKCNVSNGTNQYANTCGTYNFIDVNGTKPPNMFGRDVFRFYITLYGNILPAGSQNDSKWQHWGSASSYNCINGDGQACFERILEDGWDMKY